MGKQYFWGYFSYVILGRKLENLFRFSFSGTRSIIFGPLKIGQNDPEIPNLEFETRGFLENQVFLPTEQGGTNICRMIYQDINSKICLTLFGWKENILYKKHIVQCIKRYFHQSQLAGGLLSAFEFIWTSWVPVSHKFFANPFTNAGTFVFPTGKKTEELEHVFVVFFKH